jgi:hypothetical protein
MKHEGVEYVYFVDQLDKWRYRDRIASSIWDVREIPRKYESGMMDAKWLKMHPHLLFPGENTAWCDGHFRSQQRSPLEVFDKFDEDMIVYKHGARGCLYEEAKFCMERRVGNKKDLQRQVKRYRKEQMPEGFGLFQGNVLYRRPGAAAFNEEWWKHVNTYSTRDQVSMPFLFWRGDASFFALKERLRAVYFRKGGGGRHIFHGTRRYKK